MRGADYFINSTKSSVTLKRVGKSGEWEFIKLKGKAIVLKTKVKIENLPDYNLVKSYFGKQFLGIVTNFGQEEQHWAFRI